MKFKKLSEAFDYDQAALNHAHDLIEALNIAIEVLDSFVIRYGAFASKQLRNNTNKG